MARSELEREFVADHRQTTRALVALRKALASDDDAAIQAAAEGLDRIAGAHIAFEELWLYPLVAKSRGRDFEKQLKDEHNEVVQALSEMRSVDTTAVSDVKKVEWQQQIQTGLDHVVTCGTLLSHLSVLDESEQQEMLARLRQLRSEGVLWTTLTD